MEKFICESDQSVTLNKVKKIKAAAVLILTTSILLTLISWIVVGFCYFYLLQNTAVARQEVNKTIGEENETVEVKMEDIRKTMEKFIGEKSKENEKIKKDVKEIRETIDNVSGDLTKNREIIQRIDAQSVENDTIIRQELNKIIGEENEKVEAKMEAKMEAIRKAMEKFIGEKSKENEKINKDVKEIRETIDNVSEDLTKNRETIQRIDAQVVENDIIRQELNKIIGEENEKVEAKMEAIRKAMEKFIGEKSKENEKIKKDVKEIRVTIDNVSGDLTKNREIIQRIDAQSFENDTIIRQELNKIIGEENEKVEAKMEEIRENVENVRQEVNKTIGKINETAEEIESMKIIIESFDSNYKKVFRLEQNTVCLDTLNYPQTVGLFPCHGKGHNQEWQFTIDGELKNRKSCITVNMNTLQVLIDPCNGFKTQKWKFIAGVLHNDEYGVCLESRNNTIFAAKCDLRSKNQRFELKLLYTVDRYCTFKQGSYVFPDDDRWTLATNGLFIHQALCLRYIKSSSSLSLKVICDNSNFAKWKYTEDGQVRNLQEDVCLSREQNKNVATKCDLNLYSQRWICA